MRRLTRSVFIALAILSLYGGYQLTHYTDLQQKIVDTKPLTSPIGDTFTLVDHHGNIVTKDHFLGQPLLVFFGFTHCPDICPTKLFEITHLLEYAQSHDISVKALFISVDPERDTPESLSLYLENFHSNITGLTASPSIIAQTAKDFRAFYKKIPLEGGDYTMDHTTGVYFFNAKGQFITMMDLQKDLTYNLNILSQAQ